MISVILPAHLRDLAKLSGPVLIHVEEPVTQGAILDVLESTYPMLRGTIRDIRTKERRPFIRFFACGEDLSHEPADAVLPDDVITGKQAFRIIGALAGG